MHPLRPAGFTLIELLVVIGIIGVLAGILLVGMSGADSTSRERETRVLLDDCRSMLAEYELNASIKSAPFTGITAQPGAVGLGQNGRNHASIVTTGNVFAQLRRVQNVNAIWGKLPTDRLLNLTISTVDYQIPIDSYGNPILYVGPGGLSGTNRPGGGNVTSPDGRPFFASAGVDGDFQTHDDNLYSFQN